MRTFRFRLREDAQLLNVADWRQAALGKLPEVARSYIEGGADDLTTLTGNMSGFGKWRLRQRSLTGSGAPDLTTRLAGTDLSLPVALAPVGASGLAHWTGEPAAGRAAEACGTRMVLSAAGSYRVEEVAGATEANHWFQIYPIGARERTQLLLERVRAAGYSALFVTVDTLVLGNREGEKRWNMALPWTVTPSRALDLFRHWRWTAQVLRHRRSSAIHFLDEARAAADAALKASGPAGSLADAAQSKGQLVKLLKDDMDWDDVAWLRDQWDGPFYLKGILDADDAAHAVDRIGASGVVVSNHGGRQLDKALATIDALPAIAERIGDRAEVILDGGVRRGSDVVTALALGADAVLVGRPFVYGLATAGEEGVRAVIEIFREEIARNLTLMGCPSVAALDRSWVLPA